MVHCYTIYATQLSELVHNGPPNKHTGQRSYVTKQYHTLVKRHMQLDMDSMQCNDNMKPLDARCKVCTNCPHATPDAQATVLQSFPSLSLWKVRFALPAHHGIGRVNHWTMYMVLWKCEVRFMPYTQVNIFWIACWKTCSQCQGMNRALLMVVASVTDVPIGTGSR